MKRRLIIAGAAALALAAAFAAGRYAAPTKVVERSVLDETLVARAVANARAEWQRSITDKTVRRTIYRDGKPVERIVYVDREINSSGSSASSLATQTTASLHLATEKITTNARPGWRAGVTAAWSPGRLSLEPSRYTAEIDRRLFGTVWVGARLSTDKTAGLSLALEF
jgi:hypothetical protein